MMFMAFQTQAGDLKLEVHGKGIAGKDIRVAVYSAPEQFPSADRFFKGAVVKALSDSQIITVPDFPDGIYAVASYADSNGNARLDTNFFGRPTEPYGFSNNARGTFGPPRFTEAAFEVNGQSAMQSIQLH
jgi:uncharacterized protein (DUF2141 family)